MFAAIGIGGGEIFVVLALLLLIPLGLACMAFWIWMLVHAAQNKGLSDGERVAWVVIIALVHFIGALLYFFIGKPKANQVKPIQPSPA
jgi:Phospholipase_D-nuclease N-terminal